MDGEPITKIIEIQSLEMKKARYYQGAKYRQQLFDQLIALDSNNAEYFQGKSMAHTKIGDYHIAFPLMERAYQLNPKEMGYYYGWLLLYYYRDYERALKRLNEYDDFTPNQPDFAWGEHVNYLKGLCHRRIHNHELAIEEFDRVIELEGEHVDVNAYVYRGLSHYSLGELELAEMDFLKAIENYSENCMAYAYLGQNYIALGKKEKAKAAFVKAKELIQKGYLASEAYYEPFDGVSIFMIDDLMAKADLVE